MNSPLRTLALAGLLLGLACAPAGAAARKPTDVTVMTRNLFLGADLLPLAGSPAGDPIEQATGKVFDEVGMTEPDARMKLVAGEIAKAKPDLVGLQEVSIWRTGPKGDPAPATTVAYDFLASIKAELKRLHTDYRVVAIDLPLNLEGPSDRNTDVRFTDGNVILARKAVKVAHVKTGIFTSQLQIPTAGLGNVTVTRGWNALDATVRGARIHFVNAHLEAYSADIRLAQAKELVAGPLKSSRPTILVGDLNSGPNLPKPEDRPPFAAIADAGFVDRRTPKFQCCFNDDLKSGTWDHIVDHIMAKPGLKLVRSSITGKERTASGLSPSDHGGVVSVLRVP